MIENRVRLDDYGPVDRDDPRLVEVVSSNPAKPQRLHWRAAEAFAKLREAALEAGLDLRIASGWRPQLWPTREAYERDMIAQYGSVAEGRKWRAYKSGHMTGLVLDFGTEGLQPKSATAERQKQTPAYAWLSEHAAKYGFSPYLREPWHWELKIPREEWEQAPSSGWFKPLYVVLGAVGAVSAALGVATWLYARK